MRVNGAPLPCAAAVRSASLKQSARVHTHRGGPGRQTLIWTAEHLIAQALDMIDWHEIVNPERQLAIEVDWSSGHAKGAPGCPSAAAMASKCGSKNAQCTDINPSNVTPECLGPRSATMCKRRQSNRFYKDASARDRLVEVDCLSKVGEMQHFLFRENGACHARRAPSAGCGHHAF